MIVYDAESRIVEVRRGHVAAKRINTGIAHIDGLTPGQQAQMPFGGPSTMGVFTELRWITIDDLNRSHPI